MFELLNKLNNINYEELDIEEILDKREGDPFDSEWVRVYQAIEKLKKVKMLRVPSNTEKERIGWSMKNRKMMSWQDIFQMILA